MENRFVVRRYRPLYLARALAPGLIAAAAVVLSAARVIQFGNDVVLFIALCVVILFSGGVLFIQIRWRLFVYEDELIFKKPFSDEVSIRFDEITSIREKWPNSFYRHIEVYRFNEKLFTFHTDATNGQRLVERMAQRDIRFRKSGQ